MRLSGFPKTPANFVTYRANLRNLREKEQQQCQKPLIAALFS
jgi:hypothetical protein